MASATTSAMADGAGRGIRQRDNCSVTRVVLVRHAEPQVDNGTPAAEWPLTDRGRDDARLLGEQLAKRFTTTSLWTSPERKACQTAALAFPTVTARVHEPLGEVRKSWYETTDEHASALASYLQGEPVEGWEHREDVTSRLAMIEAEAQSSEHLVVVSHGVLLTTWVDRLIGLTDPFQFWSDLGTPDAWELDLAEKSLEHIA